MTTRPQSPSECAADNDDYSSDGGAELASRGLPPTPGHWSATEVGHEYSARWDAERVLSQHGGFGKRSRILRGLLHLHRRYIR